MLCVFTFKIKDNFSESDGSVQFQFIIGIINLDRDAVHSILDAENKVWNIWFSSPKVDSLSLCVQAGALQYTALKKSIQNCRLIAEHS